MKIYRSMPYIEPNREVTIPCRTGLLLGAHVSSIEATDIVSVGGSEMTIVNQPSLKGGTTIYGKEEDGKVCIFKRGGNIVIKNRMSNARSFAYFLLVVY